MNLTPPAIVFYLLTATAIIAWLCAVQFMLKTSRRQKSAAEQEQELTELGAAAPQHLIAGGAEVNGNAPELANRAAAYLAKQAQALLGPVKILEQTADRLVFEGMQGMVQHPGSAGSLFARGEFRFTSIAQNRTCINYAVEVPPRSWILKLGWLFVGLGLLALVVAFTLIQLYVVNAANPGLQWQAVQVIHAGHFIWPPFLFGGIYRRLRSHVRTTFDTLVHNLPYHEG
jgi:hypothetical protein